MVIAKINISIIILLIALWLKIWPETSSATFVFRLEPSRFSRGLGISCIFGGLVVPCCIFPSVFCLLLGFSFCLLLCNLPRRLSEEPSLEPVVSFFLLVCNLPRRLSVLSKSFRESESSSSPPTVSFTSPDVKGSLFIVVGHTLGLWFLKSALKWS